jgi:chromosome segregation ATPase
MSVEKPDLQEFIGFCAAESEKRKWFEGMGAFAKTFQHLKKEQEQAERARDAAVKQRDAALAEIAAKRITYERGMQESLANLERVAKEKADASNAELAKKRGELSRLEAQITQTNEVRELAQGQLDAFREDERRETAAITARLEALRAEERATRGRLEAVLKG